MNKTSEYDNIINLPHHVSTKRPQMSQHNRAAQFSPFAALTGYDAEIKETARLTDKKIESDDYILALIDSRLQILIENAKERPLISITYFVSDENKDGGLYVTVSGNVRRIDETERTIVFTQGNHIPIDDIFSIEGEIFNIVENG